MSDNSRLLNEVVTLNTRLKDENTSLKEELRNLTQHANALETEAMAMTEDRDRLLEERNRLVDDLRVAKLEAQELGTILLDTYEELLDHLKVGKSAVERVLNRQIKS